MEQRHLGNTGLRIAPVVLGGNVFGWTIDEKTSFEVLDAFVAQGFNAIDTADVYSSWAPGNKGGESEIIIGNWLKAHPERRDKITLFTKGGGEMGGTERKGLSRRWLVEAVEGSLKRLGVEAIDLYFSHFPDPDTTEEETLRAYQELIQAGKIKAIGTSNVDAEQLANSLRVARDNKLPAYQVVQPEYNLYDRDTYEGKLQDLCVAEGIGAVTYYSLASGFLTGKYRSQSDFGKSVRGGGMDKYLNRRGDKILVALDEVAKTHRANPAEVALAWLMAQPGVVAPIASATRVVQIEAFSKAVSLALTDRDMATLTTASAWE